jgi:hypothetical protein
MAALGSTPAANRYEGIVVGPRMEVGYETQVGQPVDGSRELLRQLSPFSMRFVPPDALLAAAGADTGSFVGDGADAADQLASNFNPNLMGSALAQVDTTDIATAIANVFARSTALQVSSTGQFNTAELETLLANGKFLQGQGDVNFPTMADATTAADIALQLAAMLAAPPLTLLINPSEFTINYQKLQNYGTRTRFGYIFEGWGQEQPTISFSGSTGAFIGGDASSSNSSSLTGQLSRETKTATGVQFAAKRDSAAFQNLMALYTFYRNNGYIYDTVNVSEAHLFIGAVAIDYDQWTYVGHFESFDYAYDESMPNRIEWSMEFKCSRMYDWATSPGLVLPQTSPTQSPSSTGQRAGTRSPGAITVGQAIIGSDRIGNATDEEGHVPLGLLGGF